MGTTVDGWPVRALGSLAVCVSCLLSPGAEAGALRGEAQSRAVVVPVQATKSGPEAGGIETMFDKWSSDAGRIARSKRSENPLNSLRQRVTACWSVPPDKGFERLKVSIRFGLDSEGKFAKTPAIARSSGNAGYDQSALRAVRRCGESDEPPPEGIDLSDVVVTFDAADFL